MFQMFLFTAVLFQLLLGDPRGIPKPDNKYNPSSKFWVYPKGLLPGNPLIRCPNNFSWLLKMQKSSCSTKCTLRMYKLLTLSLRLSPTAYICDLILSVTNKNS